MQDQKDKQLTYDFFCEHPEIKQIWPHISIFTCGSQGIDVYPDLWQLLFVLDHYDVPVTKTLANQCRRVYETLAQCENDWHALLQKDFYRHLSQSMITFKQKLIVTKVLSELVSRRLARTDSTCNIKECPCNTTSTEPKQLMTYELLLFKA